MRAVVGGAAIALVLPALLGAAAAPLLPADVIPPEVQQVFDEDALAYIHQSADSGEGSPNVYEDADRIANITAVNAFTPEFLAGESTDVAYAPTGDWIGTVEAGFSSVGTVTVTWQVGKPTVVGFDGDADLGGALDEVTGAQLVIYPPLKAAFAIYSDTIGPLDANAVAIIPAPMNLADFQRILLARSETNAPAADAPWAAPIGIGALALVVIAIGLLSARTLSRRAR